MRKEDTMKSKDNVDTSIKMILMSYEDLPTFGQRLRQIRKERGLTQTELGIITGLSKQQISQYETGAREPRTKRIYEIARSLDMSVGELLGSKSKALETDFWKATGKPFYQIFEDVIFGQLGLSVEEVLVFTGLEEDTLRRIISHKMQVAPLKLALILESTLNIPVDVWAGKCEYTPADVSVYGFQLARAYMQLDEHYKAIVSTVLHNNRA